MNPSKDKQLKTETIDFTDLNQEDFIAIRNSIADELNNTKVPHWVLKLFKNQQCLGNIRTLRLLKSETKVITFIIFTSLRDDEAELEYIYTPILYRKQGYARKALLSLLRDFGTVTLEVSDQNKAALRLYDSLGFKKIAVRKNYYPDGSDAEILKIN